MSLLSPEQLSRLQSDVQNELERREWAESGDTVMAEYICVLLGNGNPRDRVKTEMEDLVGTDFDEPFLDWLFSRRDALRSPPAPSPEKAPAPDIPMPSAVEASGPAPSARMFASAIEGTKRKADTTPEQQNKRRLPDGPLGGPPTGPRAQFNQNQNQNQNQPPMQQPGMGGRTLQDRLAPRGMPHHPMRGGMAARGMHNGPGGPGFRNPQMGGFHQQQQQQQQQQPGSMPGQEQMMMQMMAMQANMMQMAQQMQQMQNVQDNTSSRPTRPTRSTPGKVPSGTKLGGHSVSAIQPKGGALGSVPDKPASTALCKFGVGCSNARCTYSHPSPVADEKTGMVLSEEACEQGKNCKDPECVKSHVSPAAVNGEAAGPSRVLCKFQHCTNPTCQFRHEDESGNFIPPPALKAKAIVPKVAVAASLPSSSEDGEIEVVVKSNVTLDSALDDSKTERPCRFAERCTRADCKFAHPASRPTPRGGKPAPRGGAASAFSKRPAAAADGIVGGMTKSTKFNSAPTPAPSALNPAAGEFKPASAAGDPELQVTI